MVLAIVQARMSSTRLPAKVMKEVLEKPLIGYVFERLTCVPGIDKVILATSTHEENAVLCDYIQGIGFDIFRGSENNVLERYTWAARHFQADHVVRVTGDSPLVEPKFVEKLISEFPLSRLISAKRLRCVS